MKILFTIHADRNPDAGGAGVSAGLGEELGRLGHEVSYLSFSDLPGALPYRAKGLAFPAFVAGRLRRSRVDVIDAAVGDAWLLGALRRRAAGPLLVARSHGLVQMADRARREEARRGGLKLSWRYPLYWGGFRLWEVSRSLRAADLCFLLNDEEREFALAELGLPEEWVRVVDNGIPGWLLGRSLEDTGAAGAPFRIAHLGSYLPLKGARYVAAALGSVLERHPQARASLLGTDCPEERVLADFSPELRPRVAVMPSYRRESLPELLRGHSVILSGTLKEGFPLGTLEAMACGLAPVTAATPGPLQYVRDGENGVVVPRADGAALADGVERLIADPDLLRRLREAALATAQRYGWDRVARDTVGLYEEALERRRSRLRRS